MASTQADFSGFTQDMNLSDSINLIEQTDEYHDTLDNLGDIPVRGATGGIPRSFSNGNDSERRFVDKAELLCREADQDVTLASAHLKGASHKERDV